MMVLKYLAMTTSNQSKIIPLVFIAILLLLMTPAIMHAFGDGINPGKVPWPGNPWDVPIIINEPPENPPPLDDPPITVDTPDPEKPKLPPTPPAPDSGDPLVFTMDPDYEPNVTRNWPEQHESFLTEFDLYNTGENVTLSRTPDAGTGTLFIDYDNDRMLTNGPEWLFYQGYTVYEILSNPVIDTDQNGWFDYKDDLWPWAMIKNGDSHMQVTETGALGFNWSNAKDAMGDMHGDNRQYSDCLYEGTYLYPKCIKVSESHFAITSYNMEGILFVGGKTLPTYGSVMGHLEK